MSANTLKADVIIVGAGLVGLSAAVAMRKAGYEVVLVDDQEMYLQASTQSQEGTPDWDQRIYAISPKNAQWLASLGVWQLLDVSRIGKMQAMEIWGDAAGTPLYLSAEDVNADDLGFIVEECALKKALMRQMQDYGVHTLFGTACNKLSASPNQATLYLNNQQVIESRLLVAADGVNSWVRQQLGIGVEHKQYHQTAIVANFSAEKSHGNIARQWFRQEGFTQDASHCGILAWLPLPENKISIVWSVPTQYADALLQLDNDEFTDQVMGAGGSVLGKLAMITKPAAFPLVLKKAEVLAVDSVVLAGDAAHRVHPMAGQGVNLGFRDVIDLLEIITNKHQYQPINDTGLLKRYTRVRKADLLKMLMLTNGLYHLFDNQNAVVKKVRNWGLSATNQLAVKKMLVKSAIAL